MSQKTKPQTTIGNAVKRAIRHLGESDGSSFVNIKKHLLSVYKAGDVPDATTIKQYLKSAVDKGTLLKLDNGNYKLMETARRRKSRSRSRSRGKSKRRSRSRKRSGGRRGRRSPSSSRRRKRSSSGIRRRRRSSSGKRRRSRRSKAVAENDVELLMEYN